jgi:hypothetical protein
VAHELANANPAFGADDANISQFQVQHYSQPTVHELENSNSPYRVR